MAYHKGSLWQHRTQGTFYVHFYLAIICYFFSSAHAISFPWRLAQRATESSASPSANGPMATSSSTIAFSSAVAIESLISAQVSQLASVPPIPLPTTIDDYNTWTQVAKLMPPLQTYEAKDNTLQMMAAIRDSIRTDSDTGMTVNGLIGRGNALRVMIVGDSMTQGQEGDYTWRYRIWQWFKEQGVAVDFVGPYTGTVQPDHPAAPALPPLYGQKPLPGKPRRAVAMLPMSPQTLIKTISQFGVVQLLLIKG